MDLNKYKLNQTDLSKYQSFPTQQPQEQQRSFFQKVNNLVQNTLPNAIGGAGKAIIGDAAKLGATAVSRATEATTRLIAPNSDAAKGYEALAAENQPVNIGGIEVAQPTARNIAGDTLKTASYLFPYGKVAGAAGKVVGKSLGNIASGAAGGYLADTGVGLSDNGQSVGEALTPGLGTALGAAIPAAGAVTRGVGRLTAKAGEKLVDVGIPVSSREAQILQAYKAEKPFFTRVAEVLKGTEKAPQTAAKTATTTKAGQSISGLFGTKSNIGIQAKRASKSLWEDLIQPRLRASEQAVDMDGFFTKVQQDIIEKNPDLSRQKVLLEALDAVKQDYSGIKAVGLEQLQKYKEGWAKFVPEKAYKGKPIGGAFNDVRNQLADEARQTIYTQLGDDVKQAYFDYGNLLGLQEMGQVAMTGQKLKGGAGSFISELTSQVVTPVATVGGQVVYRLGKGIEFIGNAGAKTLGQALRFPGDKLVDDVSARVKDAKNIVRETGSQGGYISLGQDLSAPTMTQNSQNAANVAKRVNISKSITPNQLKAEELGRKINELNDRWVNKPTPANKKALDNAKALYRTLTKKDNGEIPNQLIQEAKKYKSAEEFVKAKIPFDFENALFKDLQKIADEKTNYIDIADFSKRSWTRNYGQLSKTQKKITLKEYIKEKRVSQLTDIWKKANKKLTSK